MRADAAGAIVAALIFAGCGKPAEPPPAPEPAPAAPVPAVATATAAVSVTAAPADNIPPPARAAADILAGADEVRNPQLDYIITVAVTNTKPNSPATSATYDVLVKGRERAVVRTLAPAIDKGRVLLMNGHDMWAFLPDVSKPLRISLQERLTGEVANGDLARANFTGDYTPAIDHSERVDGAVADVLQLTALSDDVTYGRVRLWVDRETSHPLKAEFYAISGRLLKTCTYEAYKELGGRVRPSRLVMTNPLVAGQTSVLEYSNLRIEELPDKYFTKDYMKKFME